MAEQREYVDFPEGTQSPGGLRFVLREMPMPAGSVMVNEDHSMSKTHKVRILQQILFERDKGWYWEDVPLVEE